MSKNREIKELIIEALQLEEVTPDDIKDSEPLFGEGLGLDSIDALELGMAVKRKYNVTLGQDKEENKKIFYSVDTISKFLESRIDG